ncbi:13067_t:CDS:2, partial [Gigaspora margarita]
ELANLLDNTGQTNLVAVNGQIAVQIENQALNEALSQPGTAIVKLRAVEDLWDEDWHIASSWPTNIAINVPNTNNGTIVVVAGIYFANYRPEELCRKFLDALPLPWLEKAKDIGKHLLLDELAKKLYEIDKAPEVNKLEQQVSDMHNGENLKKKYDLLEKQLIKTKE